MKARTYGSSILMSILMIIFGVLIAFNPIPAQLVFVYMISILAIVYAVNCIIRYCRGLDGEMSIITDLIFGLLLLISGIYVFFNAEAGMVSLPLVSGIFLIADGIIKIPVSIRYHKLMNIPLWIIILSIVAPIVLGGLLLFAPLVVATSITIFVGSFLIISGIIDVISIIYVHHKIKKMTNN